MTMSNRLIDRLRQSIAHNNHNNNNNVGGGPDDDDGDIDDDVQSMDRSIDGVSPLPPQQQ